MSLAGINQLQHGGTLLIDIRFPKHQDSNKRNNIVLISFNLKFHQQKPKELAHLGEEQNHQFQL